MGEDRPNGGCECPIRVPHERIIGVRRLGNGVREEDPLG